MLRAATVLIVTAPIAALSGLGTVASSFWTGAMILFLVFLAFTLLRSRRAQISSDNQFQPLPPLIRAKVTHPPQANQTAFHSGGANQLPRMFVHKTNSKEPKSS